MPFYRRNAERPPSFGVTEADFNELDSNQGYLNGKLEARAGPDEWTPHEGGSTISTAGIPFLDKAIRFPVLGGVPTAYHRLMVPTEYVFDALDCIDIFVEHYSSGEGSFAWELDVAVTRAGGDINVPLRLAAPTRKIVAVTQDVTPPAGKLYAVSSVTGTTYESLFSLNPNTAEKTLELALGVSLEKNPGMTAHTDGYLYIGAGANRKFYRVDVENGTITELSDILFTGGVTGTGLLTDPTTGKMYAIAGTSTGRFYEVVDVASGSVSQIGDDLAEWNGGTAMVYHQGTAYLFRESDDRLSSINLSTGVITQGPRVNVNGVNFSLNTSAGLASHNGVLYLGRDGRYLYRVINLANGNCELIGSYNTANSFTGAIAARVYDDPTIGKRQITKLTIPQSSLSAALSSLTPPRIQPMDGVAVILGLSLANIGGATPINRSVRVSNTWIRLGGYTAVSRPGRVRNLTATRIDASTMRVEGEAPLNSEGVVDTTITSYEYNLGSGWVDVGNVLTADVTVTAGTYNVYVRAVNPWGYTAVPPFASVTV